MQTINRNSIKKIIWILFFSLTACKNNISYNKPIAKYNNTVKLSENFKKVTKDSIHDILNLLCNNISYEIINLYPETQTIIENNFLILDDSLKARGFVVIDWDAATGRMVQG